MGNLLRRARRLLGGGRRAAQPVPSADVHALQATIEALARAIGAREHPARTDGHRVQTYAMNLARDLGLAPALVDAVGTAALLRDIGKLAVPEHILSKSAPHTPEEAQRVRVHAQVGADILRGVPFPHPVADMILHHHERWDGAGYPSGRSGEDIPIGARIIGLVEFFDTLTTGRNLLAEAAATLVAQEAGRAFDPRVVQVFLSRSAGWIEPSELLPPPPSTALTAEQGTVFDDIALAHQEIHALYEVAQAMGTSLGVLDTMTLIASKLSHLVPFSTCALFLYDETSETLRCRFATGLEAQAVESIALAGGQGLSGWVARNRRPLVNARPSADFHGAALAHETTLQSALVCPLVTGDRLIGTLAVYHTSPAFYRDDHRRLLDRVCRQAAAVIRNAVVFEQAHEASLTDSLTGLPNTRFMFLHLSRELARAERLGSQVALLVIDLNDFKTINDTWGHHVGDRALREVARALPAVIRPYDLCVRYAGDEFIVVLVGCDAIEAERKRRELKVAVDQIVFEPQPDHRVSLSISAGAAVFPHDGRSYELLMATADGRMYEDKNASRRPDSERQPPAAPRGDTPDLRGSRAS